MNTLVLALLYAFQNSGFLLRVSGTGFYRVQFALCIPKAGQCGKYRLKVCRKVFKLQIKQRVGRKVWLDEDCAQ